MRVFTSYYAKMKDKWWQYALVRVSTSSPAWFPVGLHCIPELYPGWALVSGIKENRMTWEEYRQQYMEMLSKLDKASIQQKLQEISDIESKKDIVLLCYEAISKPCHRHLIAEWLGNVEEL